MPETLQNIGNFFSSSGGKSVLTGATAGGGFLQNLLANREAQSKQNFVEGLIKDPAKFNAFVNAQAKPLSAGLTTDIARSTDAYGAERGLGSSPTVMKDIYAQALAPYEYQQQQAALQQALEKLGLLSSSPSTKPVDITSLLKMLQTAPASTPIGPVLRDAAIPPGGFPTLTSDVPNQLPVPEIGGGDQPITSVGGDF